MQFGLWNVLAAFQRMVNKFFVMYVVLYLDNIIIFSKDPAQHNAHMREVLWQL